MQMISTSMGVVEEKILEKRLLKTSSSLEETVRTEYWFMGMLVRSDVHIKLREAPALSAILGQFK